MNDQSLFQTSAGTTASASHQDVGGLKLTLGVYLVVLVLKLIAFWVSGVVAVFAEALHIGARPNDLTMSRKLLAAKRRMRGE